jgi:RNA polymerase sigma factor (sigma-70 family)
MTESRVTQVVRGLRTVVPGEAASDAQLLECFVGRRDEAAFAELLRRHGPMVLGLCRRLLGAEDAEDAFQGTFLVLAKKAASIARRELLGNWLYGVAYRTALRARTQAARRQAREREMAKLEAVEDESPDELLGLLDQELTRLPDKYRLPVVLCELEGKTYKEAARLLGWSEGTLAGRLSRARALLARRLTRRGAALGAAAVTSALTHAGAVLPPRLVEGTARAALALVHGQAGVGLVPVKAAALADQVVRAMLLSRLRTVLAVLVLLLGLGYPLAALGPRPQEKPPPPGEPRQASRQVKVDRLGDPLPPGAVVRLGSVRLRHRGPIAAFAVSPDGKLLASGGSADHMVRLWDARTGRLVWRIAAEVGGAEALVFSPDGKRLATAGGGCIRLWDVVTAKEVCRLSGLLARCLAFSPDGRLLAAGGYDKLIRLWDVARKKEVRQLRGHEEAVSDLHFARGGRMLVSLSQNKAVRLWDPRTGGQERRLTEPGDRVSCVAIAPDGKTLATGSLDRTVRLWDVSTGKQLRRWAAQESPPSGLAFSPDGRTLAVTSFDGRIRLWEAGTGKLRRERARLGVPGLGGLGFVRFLSGGTTLACVSDRVICLLDVASLKERWPALARQQGISSLALSRDGKLLATGLGDINYGTVRGGVRLWEAATGREVREFTGPPGPVFGVALSPNGKVLAGAGWDSKVWLWDVSTGKALRQLGDAPGRWWSVAFAPDGRTLAAAENSGGVQLWDPAASKTLRRLPTTGMSPAPFSADGSLIALGSGEDSITLYEPTTGKAVRQLSGPAVVVRSPLATLPTLHFVTFSPDGRTLASTGAHGVIRLWDTRTGRPSNVLKGHKEYVDSLAFAPDGRTLASGGSDGTIILWEVATGRERRRLLGHDDRVTALAFSPDGKRLASGSHDTTGLIWDVTGRD